MKQLYIAMALSIAFTACKKDDDTDLTPQADFSYEILNEGEMPAQVAFTNSSTQTDENTWYSWEVWEGVDNGIPDAWSNDENFTATLDQEGFYTAELKATNFSGNVETVKTVEFTILDSLYYQSVNVSSGDVSCQSFDFDGITYTFSEDSGGDVFYGNNPLAMPIGVTDAGDNYILDANISRDTKIVIESDLESGMGIWDYDYRWYTSTIDIDIHDKFYIYFTDDCIDSVKAVKLD